MRARAIAAFVALAGAAAGWVPASGSDTAAARPCGTSTQPLVITGAATPNDAKTYRLEPFDVPENTGRIAVTYSWADRDRSGGTPLTATTFDLGLWDEDGPTSPEGFRGWSGSRQKSIFVQGNAATRGYLPGPIEPGTWHVELGIAAVSPGGADWRIEVVCGPANPAEPTRLTGEFPANHTANPNAGWYHGDFHMHGYHSAANAPDWPDIVAQARAAKLDFLPITDYVTTAHWAELGPVQQDPANADVLLWPGREIITYFGHANSLGITPGAVEYRRGLKPPADPDKPVSMGDIQKAVKDAGGLFQVNHPTIFPGPVFQNFCRGCEFTLGDEIDWHQVDTIEVVTGPAVARPSDAGAPKAPTDTATEGENPFMQTAVDLWDDLLLKGYKVAPVSGSDYKGAADPADRARIGYGSSATAVYADNLSIDALRRGIAAGHVYVRTRGVLRSPALDVTAVTADGEKAMFGDVLRADRATMTVKVTGGAGQVLRIVANGDVVAVHPLASNAETVMIPITRLPATEGPLGTFWRVETLDAKSRTTIGNAVFLAPPTR